MYRRRTHTKCRAGAEVSKSFKYTGKYRRGGVASVIVRTPTHSFWHVCRSARKNKILIMPNLHREGADIPERIWYPPVFFGERKDMNNTRNQKLLTLVLAAMFFALGYLLPYASGQIKEIG